MWNLLLLIRSRKTKFRTRDHLRPPSTIHSTPSSAECIGLSLSLSRGWSLASCCPIWPRHEWDATTTRSLLLLPNRYSRHLMRHMVTYLINNWRLINLCPGVVKNSWKYLQRRFRRWYPSLAAPTYCHCPFHIFFVKMWPRYVPLSLRFISFLGHVINSQIPQVYRLLL